ncbi:hypothetical protein E4U41_003194 [Claviceps citrina]|nr:hypothetical protein E4U41_003194 [Claviceps citrina]
MTTPTRQRQQQQQQQARPDAEVEILVHVAAPSRVADDATYRRLARAYLAFRADEARTRVRVGGVAWGAGGGGGGDGGGDGDGEEEQREEEEQQERAEEEEDWSPGRHVGPVPWSESLSWDLSFQSALDNRSSPRLWAAEREQDRPGASASASASASPMPSSPPLPSLPPPHCLRWRAHECHFVLRAVGSSVPKT